MESRYEDLVDEKHESRMVAVMALWVVLALSGASAALLASLGVA